MLLEVHMAVGHASAAVDMIDGGVNGHGVAMGTDLSLRGGPVRIVVPKCMGARGRDLLRLLSHGVRAWPMLGCTWLWHVLGYTWLWDIVAQGSRQSRPCCKKVLGIRQRVSSIAPLCVRRAHGRAVLPHRARWLMARPPCAAFGPSFPRSSLACSWTPTCASSTTAPSACSTGAFTVTARALNTGRCLVIVARAAASR